MNKVILFLKHGNRDRPLMRHDVAVACGLFLLFAAGTAHLSHLMSTLCLASAVLLAVADVCAAEEDNHLLVRRIP